MAGPPAFRRASFGGYDRDEVDAWADQVLAELDAARDRAAPAPDAGAELLAAVRAATAELRAAIEPLDRRGGRGLSPQGRPTTPTPIAGPDPEPDPEIPATSAAIADPDPDAVDPDATVRVSLPFVAPEAVPTVAPADPEADRRRTIILPERDPFADVRFEPADGGPRHHDW